MVVVVVVVQRKEKRMSHDLNHLCLQSNPKFDNIFDVLKVYSDMYEDVPYTMHGRCRRFSKISAGPKIFCDVYRIYSKIFVYHACTEIAEQVLSFPMIFRVRTEAADAFRHFPKILS